jgi:hypothetical protein
MNFSQVSFGVDSRYQMPIHSSSGGYFGLNLSEIDRKLAMVGVMDVVAEVHC